VCATDKFVVENKLSNGGSSTDSLITLFFFWIRLIQSSLKVVIFLNMILYWLGLSNWHLVKAEIHHIHHDSLPYTALRSYK
jgi:hypothetical protein